VSQLVVVRKVRCAPDGTWLGNFSCGHVVRFTKLKGYGKPTGKAFSCMWCAIGTPKP